MSESAEVNATLASATTESRGSAGLLILAGLAVLGALALGGQWLRSRLARRQPLS